MYGCVHKVHIAYVLDSLQQHEKMAYGPFCICDHESMLYLLFVVLF